MGTVGDNLKRVREQIAGAAEQAGRSVDEITIVAVSKRIPEALIQEALSAGQTIFGENRINEARERIPHFAGNAQWHMVGHLQTNKAKYAVRLFDLIQSVDSVPLAGELNHRAELAGKIQDVLVQVNTTAESQKSGCGPEETIDLAGRVREMKHVQLRGLMTIGPYTDEENQIRRSFCVLREKFEELRSGGGTYDDMKYLSMGMSGDYALAIAEGANMLRIGTAIFGPRDT